MNTCRGVFDWTANFGSSFTHLKQTELSKVNLHSMRWKFRVGVVKSVRLVAHQPQICGDFWVNRTDGPRPQRSSRHGSFVGRFEFVLFWFFFGGGPVPSRGRVPGVLTTGENQNLPQHPPLALLCQFQAKSIFGRFSDAPSSPRRCGV